MKKRSKQPDPRTRILEAAAAAFAESGFAGARVDEIAARAGVNKAMLYYHVGDKAALYNEVLTHNFDRVLTSIRTAVAQETDPKARLRSFIDGLACAAGEINYHPQIMLHEIACSGANLQSEIAQKIFEGMNLLIDILNDGVESGRFRPTDPLLTHLTIVGAVVFMTSVAPVIDRFKNEAPPEAKASAPWSQSDLAEHLFELLTTGLKAQGDEQ